MTRRRQGPARFDALGLVLLGIERELAERRMKAGKKPDPMANLPQGAARDLAGAQVGLSGRTLDMAGEEYDACGLMDIQRIRKKHPESVRREVRITRPLRPPF